MFTMVKKNLPKSSTALEKAYQNCTQRGRFKQVEKSAYGDYLQRAQKDLVSAERDLSGGDLHWARVKAYQALFHLLNALLVKHLGFFSKDHGCVIVALMSYDIITSKTAEELSLLKQEAIKSTITAVYQDLDEFRIQRNFALYKPKACEEVIKEDVQSEIEKIKANFKVLVRLL